MGDIIASTTSSLILLEGSHLRDYSASTDWGLNSRGSCRSNSNSSSSSSIGSSSRGWCGSKDEQPWSQSSSLSFGAEEGGTIFTSLQHLHPVHHLSSRNCKSSSIVYAGYASVSTSASASANFVGGDNLLTRDRFDAVTHPSVATYVVDGVRVCRDPNLLLITEPNFRQVDSVQHQLLLMSHQAVANASPSSSSSSAAAAAAVVSPSSIMTVRSTSSVNYPEPPSVTSMISPHFHHPLPSQNIYPHIPEMWKQQQRYAVPGLPITPGHLHPVTDELFDRERPSFLHEKERHDRIRREHEEEREVNKQKEREKYQLERERQETDKLEKQRAEQAVEDHFTESLKRSGYNLRIERDQQRLSRPELRERDKLTSLANFPPYSGHNVPLPLKTTNSNQHNRSIGEYVTSSSSTAVIQSRVNPVKSQMTSSKSSEPPPVIYNNMYGYPAYAQNSPSNYFQDKLKNAVTGAVVNALSNVKTTASIDRERERDLVLPGSHTLTHPAVDIKNSVIVKNDGKNSSHSSQLMSTVVLTPSDKTSITIPAHSVSPKLRINESHYLQPSSYEYRSPSQSPLQVSNNNISPHLLHRQSSTSASHPRQSPLPPTHQRQSPHHRLSPLPVMQQQLSPQMPQSHHPHSPHTMLSQQQCSPAERYPAMYAKTQSGNSTGGGTSATYQCGSGAPAGATAITTVNVAAKLKGSNPALPHIYTKSASGTVARVQEISISAVPLTKMVIPTSPYQQLSQHQLPPSTTSSSSCSASSVSSSNGAPPPAHSSRTSSLLNDLHLFVSPSSSSGGQNRKHNETINSTRVAIALPSQTQPLDLGCREQSVSTDVTSKQNDERETPVVVSPKRKLEESEEEGGWKKMRASISVGGVPSIFTSDETSCYEQTSVLSPLSNAVSMTRVTTSTATITDENGTVLTSPVPCSSPGTPSKNTPFSADGDKSNSPKPPSYGGHKLKKAWLQRHSGGDVSDENIAVRSLSKSSSSLSTTNGSLSIKDNDGNVPPNGSPATNSPSTRDVSESNSSTSLNSLSGIGSMAVNSISKNKTLKGSAKKGATPLRESGSSSSSRSSPVIVNGHVTAGKQMTGASTDESSCSDVDTKSSSKRVLPKIKRKKHAGGTRKAQQESEETSKRKKLNSTSSTDSDKESASEKDSDNSTGKKTTGGGTEDKKDGSRKRGRKPKVSGSYSSASNGSSGGGKEPSEDPKEKRAREDSKEPKDPFPKPSISHLKKTGESFLQDGPCFEVAPKLAKCRECRWTPNQRSRNNSNIFCRFYAFRRLRFTKNGQLAIAGFSDPHKDPKQEDLSLWLPNTKNPPNDLDLEIARFTLVQVGDQFCDLLTQESEALNIHISEDKKIAWKRVVQGVREMCDVCETTLFNFHWACSKCGFVVCIDCYKSRKNGTVKVWGDGGKDRDDMSWLLCTNRQPHEQEKLMLTQIIAGDSLSTLAKQAHESRAMWDIAMYCGCPLSTATSASSANSLCKEILRNLKQEKQKKAEQFNDPVKTEPKDENCKKKSPLTWLADVALSNQARSSADEGESSSDSEDGSFSTLRELLVGPANKANGSGSQPASPFTASGTCTTTSSTTTTAVSATITPSVGVTAMVTVAAATSSSTISTSSTTIGSATTISAPLTAGPSNKSKKKSTLTFDELIQGFGEEDNNETNDDYLPDGFINGSGNNFVLKHFVRNHLLQSRRITRRDHLPIRIMTLSESKILYPDVPHSWLCDGRLLRLKDSVHPGNYTIFQDQWRRGQPVIVSDVSKLLDLTLWHPDSFIADFGDVKNDLINCMTGNIVPNQPMRKFWEGFEFMSRRLKDEKGNSMLLKLKDWPPGEDFAEMLPSRYNDLMRVLPLGEYTQRNGKLNLASRLPECFVRPDLGPKMYNAYGSAMYPNKGTTNLHLDISDAVNVMVYVGIPKDGDNEEHIKEAYRAIDEAGCDILTRRRVREKGELPGALWHIYSARDADKIRDLLNKVAIEKGARLEPNHDPIHDQSWYLDGILRERLRKEYAVEGYAIVQCMGDAVFVPAGAPHQVRNLHNCIKVAEDFVSPENVSHCFHLTQEFRDLSDTHSNHEDKLQIKNIMYHAVKDSLSVLGAALLKKSASIADTEHIREMDVETKISVKSEAEEELD